MKVLSVLESPKTSLLPPCISGVRTISSATATLFFIYNITLAVIDIDIDIDIVIVIIIIIIIIILIKSRWLVIDYSSTDHLLIDQPLQLFPYL